MSAFCWQVDWDELGERLMKMQEDCKASWDHLRAIVKHDNNIVVKIRSEIRCHCRLRNSVNL